MAKFDKKKLAEACDGLKNAVVNQLCNENLPKKPEDWARLFETQAEKAIEENNKLLPAAFARTLKKETEALAKMFPNNKQNTEIMKEKTTVFVVSSKFCGDFCTATYYCELLTTFTVQEFVQAVLQNKKEWGYIKVGDNILSAKRLEYRHGEIVSDEHGVSSIKDTVKRIDCNGVWSFKEYLVQI